MHEVAASPRPWELALGVIEVVGLVPALTVLDTVVKHSDVALLARVDIGDGLVALLISGDIASVQLACTQARQACHTGNWSLRSTVIGRPSQDLFSTLVQPRR